MGILLSHDETGIEPIMQDLPSAGLRAIPAENNTGGTGGGLCSSLDYRNRIGRIESRNLPEMRR